MVFGRKNNNKKLKRRLRSAITFFSSSRIHNLYYIMHSALSWAHIHIAPVNLDQIKRTYLTGVSRNDTRNERCIICNLTESIVFKMQEKSVASAKEKFPAECGDWEWKKEMENVRNSNSTISLFWTTATAAAIVTNGCFAEASFWCFF